MSDGDDDEIAARTRRRAPVRRSLLPKTRLGRILLGLGVVAVVVAAWIAVLAIRYFFEHDSRFRIDSASSIQIAGNSQVLRQDLLGVFGEDIGRNIFFVPMAARRTELESLPWVEHATVMRLLPNQLRIAVTERTPVAFVRKGNRIELIDRNGVVLTMPPAMLAAKHYSFPVISGVAANQDPEMRADRMRLYQRFMEGLDEGGAKASETLSEVDLSDPEDIRALIPVSGSDILVHFGESDFANRYRTFQSHLPEWQREYPHLAAVDLRYDQQTVLEMAKGAEGPSAADTGNAKPGPGSPAAGHKAAGQPRALHGQPSRFRGAQPATRHATHPALPRHAVAHTPAKSAGKGKRLPAARG